MGFSCLEVDPQRGIPGKNDLFLHYRAISGKFCYYQRTFSKPGVYWQFIYWFWGLFSVSHVYLD
jgi:hypothetical protein